MRLLWLAFALLLAACDQTPPPSTATPFAGSNTCQSCHAAQYNDWLQSHHQLAMQTNDPINILGQFPAPALAHHQQQSTFNADNTINIEGQKLTLAYVFGLYPLQQYLSPQKHGALQALPQAWDSRPAADGGQRWFHLYSEETIQGPADPLHWASPSHNANHMCIECHTTGFQKNVSRDGSTFNSQWSELGVSCESCHGNAVAHIEWAQAANTDQAHQGFNQPLHKALQFVRQADLTQKPHAEQAASYHPQIEQCANCHSRRARISDDANIKSLYDHFMPSLIDSSLYHVDGQIKDEVFEFGAFMQSKMAHAGVTCSNCHNPHSAKLKIEGNGLCLQCHADDYNTPKHTLHPLGSAGSQCIDCHMPVTTYMQIDDRRDHSFRIPRPDLSDKLGTPNACQQCHTEENQTITQWQQQHWGKNWQQPHYGEVFWRAERGYRDSVKPLMDLITNETTPLMVRAQALSLLNGLQPHGEINTEVAAGDNPLMQLALLGASPNASLLAAEDLLHLLSHSPKAVKFEALRWLSYHTDTHTDPRYQTTRNEYLASLAANADRAPSHTALAQLLINEGDTKAAINSLKRAIELEPYYVPAVVNLTDLLRAEQRDDDAKPLFEKALSLAADSADLQHAYGLWLVRQGKLSEAVTALKQAAELSERPYYRYVYALALAQTGNAKASFDELIAASDSEYYDPTVLQAAAEQAAQQSRFHTVRKIMQRWRAFDPEHPVLKQLEQWLQQQQ